MVLPEPVLVGREEELKELQHSLDSVFSGRGKTVFISGEAGSGKTRLINEFLNITRKRGIIILFGWCLSNTTVPYFPFIEALTSDFTSREGGTLLSQSLGMKSWPSESHLIKKGEKNRTIVPQVWKDQAFTAVIKELLYLSSVKPLILVLEDMHWADSASLALLHYISRAIINEKILVLVTFRSEELSRDAEGHFNPLDETINLMGREDLFKEIQLANLNQDDVRGMAESMVGGKVNSELVEKLVRESRGNPLFVVEFLRMLSEHGSLVRDKDQWRLSVGKLGMPSKVKGVIMRRISALDPDQRRVLDVASVIGEKFNPDLIAGVLSKDRIEILEVLNRILKATSLVIAKGNLYTFYHPKSREVLYEEISSPLKRGYHGRVAEQIENAIKNSQEIPLSDLAYHFTQAGNKEKSVKYALEAGQEALARFSNIEAIKHFNYVLESVDKLDELSVERNVALEGLGDAYHANCLFEDAIKTFERLAKSETGAIRLRAYRKAMDAAWFTENPSRMLQLVKEAEKYATSDRLERARLLRNKGRALNRLSDFKTALRSLEEGLQISKEEYSLPDVASLLAVTGGTRIVCGLNAKEGVRQMQQSISLRQELGDIRGELLTKVNRNFLFGSLGLFQEVAGEYNNMLEIGEKIGDFESLAETTIFMSVLLEGQEKFEEAIALSLKALEYYRKTDTERLGPIIYAALTRQYARIRDLKRANHYFNILMKIRPKILSYPRNAPGVALAEAVLFAAKSQWKEANQGFQKVFETSKKGFWQHQDFKSTPTFRRNYIWALELQGRTEEAEIQRELILRATAKTVKRFTHADLQADLIMKKRIVVAEENELRLDLVNIGRRPGSIIKINGLIPTNDFKVIAFPSYCCLQNGDLEMKEREIGAFQVETVKLTVEAVKTGVLTLNPSVVYVDDLGETKTCKPKSIKIIVDPRLSITEERKIVETKAAKLEFRSEAAQKAFDFLVKAFVEDYFHRRLSKEWSGWRTLMDVVKKTPVSHYSMYGSGKYRGYVASELERLGVVEFRIFFGERGRGGRVFKLRVDAEKETIQNYVDQYKSKGSKKNC